MSFSHSTASAAASSFVPFSEQFRRTVRATPDAVAVDFEGHRLDYTRLADRAGRLANALIARGVGPGDRVATLSANRLESVEEILAIALAGAVRVPLYTHNTVKTHAHMLRVSGARALIVDAPEWERLAPARIELPDLRVVITHGPSPEVEYDAVLAAAPPDDPQLPSGPDDLAVLRFSSGTTGLPKGIMHRQREYFELGEALARTLEDVAEDTVQIIAGPMSHISGAFFWPMIARGARQIVMPRFDAGRFVDHIEAGGTVSLIVPTMLKSVLEVPGLEQRRLSTLRRIGYGGSPIDETTLRRAIAVFGPVFAQSYGQSEASPISALGSADHDVHAPGFDPAVLRSAGRPVPGATVRIVDEDGTDVSPGEVGEIAVRAPWTMNEIWGDPEATAARFLPDGSLLTRDMGYLRDGYLYLADRKDDMIISGGFNIWPTELENALMAHPAVAEAAVIGVPHEHWGETPVGIVVLRPGTAAESAELVAWCREQVGSVKKPSAVIVRDAPLPRNGTGKLLRRELRETYGAAGGRPRD